MLLHSIADYGEIYKNMFSPVVTGLNMPPIEYVCDNGERLLRFARNDTLRTCFFPTIVGKKHATHVNIFVRKKVD
jgi:hypothetical protein